MKHSLVSCTILLVCAAIGSANNYIVSNTDDSGAGSLRWAINQANRHAGADTISMDACMGGETIQPLTRLPAIQDDRTTLNGMTSYTILEKVTLSGALVPDNPANDGLRVTADYCTIEHLRIINFPGAGVHLTDASHCTVTHCHIGVDETGNAAAPNHGGIWLERSDRNLVGATASAYRNVIVCSPSDNLATGIVIVDGSHNTVMRNHIGVNVAGSAALGGGWRGIVVAQSQGVADDNRIGGTDNGSGNVIGSFGWGIVVSSGATRTKVRRNHIGVLEGLHGALTPIGQECILIMHGALDTVVGGATIGERNVLAGGAQCGVRVEAGANRTVIRRNYLGTDRAGEEERALLNAIRIEGAEGMRVTVGGADGAGNVIVPSGGEGGTGVIVSGPLTATISHNTMGTLPDGSAATAMRDGVYVDGSSPTITDNNIEHGLLAGILVVGDTSNPQVYRNEFGYCNRAVWIMSGRCRLGNLGNVRGTDNGGNLFAATNDWTIYNGSTNPIKAEGNDFETTLHTEIDAKICDRLDLPSRGRVDYDPLSGGVHPTDVHSGVRVTGLTAVPTHGGAEIALALSAPAEVSVEILNLAGRPVAIPARNRALRAGAHRLLWDGCSATGLRVPAGRYLVRVTARGPRGEQAAALSGLTLP